MLPSDQDGVQELLQRCDLIIVDPPFSAPLEVPAPLHALKKCDTLQALAATLSRISARVKIMLLFPYFEQQRVIEAMPYLHMLDYRVRYNHKNYAGQDSPVRIFTNIPLPRVPSPQEAGYLLCLHCNDWMFHTNSHCQHCNSCTSVGGVARRHCFDCGACVKAGSLHCSACSSCHPKHAPCPPASRCTVCASLRHRRHSCPKFKEIVEEALQPWAIPLPPCAPAKVAGRGGQKPCVTRGVCKRRPRVFISAHVLSRVAVLKYRWRSRRR